MENASKALIIAGGVLLAILILSLIVYARTSISEYQNSKTELANVEKIAKFNEQFSQYDRKDVTGYELISLANKIADYNTRYSKDGPNNEGYNPIKMVISFKDKNNGSNLAKSLAYDGNTNYLFTEIEMKQNSKENDIVNTITENLNCETAYGGEEVLSRIARNINAIFKEIDSSLSPEKKLAQEKQVLKKFYEIVPSDIRTKLNVSDDIYTSGKIDDGKVGKIYVDLTKNDRTPKRTIKTDAYKYYEYIQFKRSIFECDSMNYDNKTGRISEINYSFVKIR